jgi:adenosine deaminase
LTDLTKEYYKAASMTKGGLSKWDVLRIIRNGFRSAFLSFGKRKELLIEAENEIGNFIVQK